MIKQQTYLRVHALYLLTATLFLLHLKKTDAINSRLTNILKSRNNTAIACQDEETFINCNQYEGIRVVDAFWGRDNDVDCDIEDPLSTQTIKGICYPHDRDYAYRKVAEICQGHQSCSLMGSSTNFDTTLCPHIRKFARVVYECRQLSGMRRSHVLNKLGARKSDIV